MNPTTQDIKDILVGTGEFTFGADLFISKMPQTPVNITVLYDTSGANPEGDLDGQWYLYDHFQVVIRDNKYQAAFTKAYKVINALIGKANFTINNTEYIIITLLSGPEHIRSIGSADVPEPDRAFISINFQAQKKLK